MDQLDCYQANIESANQIAKDSCRLFRSLVNMSCLYLEAQISRPHPYFVLLPSAGSLNRLCSQCELFGHHPDVLCEDVLLLAE